MIYYDLQHHGEAAFLPWLARMIADPGNSLHVSYDGTDSECAGIAAELARAAPPFRMLRVERSPPVRWCGPSTVALLMAALRRAVETPGWEFFVNISGTCIPLASQGELIAHLGRGLAEGVRAHLFAFRVRKPWVLGPEDPGQPIRRARLGRLFLEGNARLIESFRDPGWFPVSNPANRVMLMCREPDDRAAPMAVARPDTAELAFRRDYLARHPHYCGRAWFMLHRSAVEDLVAFFDGPAFADTGRFFLTCFEPDESFLATIVMNGLALGPGAVANDNLRAFRGAPRRLGDGDIAALRALRGVFFARKIQHGQAQLLRAFVEARAGIA